MFIFAPRKNEFFISINETCRHRDLTKENERWVKNDKNDTARIKQQTPRKN